MTDKPKDALLPCPFCGSYDVHLEPQGLDAAVHCYACSARGRVECIEDHDKHYSIAKGMDKKFEAKMERAAIKAWNTRTPAEAVQNAVRKVGE